MKKRTKIAAALAAVLALAGIGNLLPQEAAPTAPPTTAPTATPTPTEAPKAAKWTHAFKSCEDLEDRWFIVADKAKSPNMAADRRVVVMDTLGLRAHEKGCSWQVLAYGETFDDFPAAETE